MDVTTSWVPPFMGSPSPPDDNVDDTCGNETIIITPVTDCRDSTAMCNDTPQDTPRRIQFGSEECEHILGSMESRRGQSHSLPHSNGSKKKHAPGTNDSG